MAKILSEEVSDLNKILQNQQFIIRNKLSNPIMFDHWPMSSGDYMDTWEDVFTTDDYGEDYDALKKSADFSAIANGKLKTTIENTTHDDYRDAFNLIYNGFTPMRMLGKQHDMQMNKSIFKDRMSSLTGRKLRYPIIDDWAKLSINEKNLTPQQFIAANVADRLARNPALIDQLKTKQQLAADNYKIDNRGIPVGKNEKGEELYDSIWFKDDKQKTNYSVSRISPNLSINDFGNMNVVENFDSVLNTITKNTKILILEDPQLSANNVSLRKRKLYTVGRTVKNTVKKITNKREHGVKDSYVLRYSPQNTKAEQLYVVLKGLCFASVEPYLTKAERLIKAGSAINLPSLTEFESNRNNIKNAAACLIAGQICNMFNLEPNDAYIFSEAFRAEACQHLASAKTSLTNEWMMPLISDMFSLSVYKFAEDFKVNRNSLSNKLGATTDDIMNLGAALFAKRQPVENNILGQTLQSKKLATDVKDVYDKKKFKGMTINTFIKEINSFIYNDESNRENIITTDPYNLTKDLNGSKSTPYNKNNQVEIQKLFNHFGKKNRIKEFSFDEDIKQIDEEIKQTFEQVDSEEHKQYFRNENGSILDADWKYVYDENGNNKDLTVNNQIQNDNGTYVTFSEVFDQMYREALDNYSKNLLPQGDNGTQDELGAVNVNEQNNLNGSQPKYLTDGNNSNEIYPDMILLPPIKKDIPDLKNYNEDMLIEDAKKAEALNKEKIGKNIAALCKEMVRKEVYNQGLRLAKKTLKNENDLAKLKEDINKNKIKNLKNFNNEATKFSNISASLSLGLDALKSKINVDSIKNQIEESTKNIDIKRNQIQNNMDETAKAKELENLETREVMLHSLTGSVELNSYALSLTDEIMEFYNKNKSDINTNKPADIVTAYAESTYSIANGTAAVRKFKQDIRTKCANPVITKTYQKIYGSPSKVNLFNDKMQNPTRKTKPKTDKSSIPNSTKQTSLKTF